MNVTVIGVTGKHGELVTASVMAYTVVHEVFGRIPTTDVPTISTHALQTTWEVTTRGVMLFVIMEEHRIATPVTVLRDFMENVVDIK